MKQAFRKNIFRTIKKSLGRYMAILAIIALGVGFFSGLKVSKPSMMKTGQEYVRLQNMYDYRLISTWGFQQEEIEQISKLDGVKLAEGAVSEDFIYQNEENESICLKALSITENINKLTVEAGRMPEKTNECVLDAIGFSEDMIGKEIRIADVNSQETKDSFVYDTYIVTGLVRSPLYMNMERGTTTIGNGKINSFIFMPIEAFDFEYYEEVYVTTGLEEAAFTQVYEEAIEAGAETMEEHTLSMIDVRYQQEITDANEKIADAEQEIADAEQEIADAEQEIADAEQEIADAEQEIADGERELADGERKIADAEKEIADGEKELTEKTEEARQELGDAKKKLEDGQKQLEDGRKQLEDATKTLDTNEQELIKGEKELKKGKKQYEKGLKEYNKGKKQYEEGLKEYQIGVGEYEKGLAEYEAGKVELEKNRTGYEQALAAKQQMETLMTPELLQQNPEYLQVSAAVSTFEAGEQELNNAKSQLDTAQAEMAVYKKTLDAAKKELDTAKKQLDDSLIQIEKNEKTIQEGKKQIKEGRQEILDSKQKLDDSEKEIEAGWKEYNDGLAELEKQISDGEKKLADGKAELADARVELADGKKELEDGKVELADGKKELEDGKHELADAKEELAEVEAPEVYVLDRSMNIGCASYESDVGIVDGIAKLFPIFFFLIAALVCSTTMTRMVDDERTQIGTLRALGYSEMAILMKYVIYSGSAAGIGAVSGYFAGTRLFPWAIWTAYDMMYGFMDIVLVENIGLLFLSLLVSLLCSVGTTFAACHLELSHAPAELIRPKAPSAGKRILLERISFVWKHMKFLHKVSARNIFRFKKRMIMMILGIAGCTALVVAGFGVKDSVANIANNQYDLVMKYHINATYTEEITPAMLTEIQTQFEQELKCMTVLLETSVDAPFEDGSKTVTLMASDDEHLATSVDFHLDGEKVALAKKGEVLIDERLAKVLSVNIGEEVVFKTGEKESKPLKVAGIFENYNNYYAYVTAETYEEYFGEAFIPKTLYLSLEEGMDHYRTGSYLANMENAANISIVADTRAMVENTMESMNFIVALVIGCAAALAFIVMFNLGNINISERVREIATLKVLGFYPRETGAYVFRESAVLSFLGIAVGLPLGALLHRFVILQIKVDMVTFEMNVRPISFLYSALAVWGFTICVDLMMRKKINGINMAEALKSIE